MWFMWFLRRLRRLPRALVLAVLLLLAGGALLGTSAPSLQAAVRTASPSQANCDGPIPGKHIYDCTGLLTPSEVANLESHAKAVEQAGAPTIVYLQARDATSAETEQDAINLMNRWNVQSSPGARDGFVMFLNLKPSDLRHGQVFLYAGQKLVNGNLPTDESQRIYSDVMLPLLKDGKTAEGIAAGLDAVAHSLRYGPPPPSPATLAARSVGRLPFNILSLLFAAAIALYYVWMRRGRPAPGPRVPTPPGQLAPAIAGALVTGRVRDDQMEATIFDFARRGHLQIEPDGKQLIKVRLLENHALTGYEASLWHLLASNADDDHVLVAEDLAQVARTWSSAKSDLGATLVSHGWYDPVAAAAKRRTFYAAGVLGICIAVIGYLMAAIAKEPWAAIGATLCLAAGVAAFVLGQLIPDTTLQGEQEAAPWRGYLDSIKRYVSPDRFDEALPYLIAMGAKNVVPSQLQTAGGAGYVPSWFRAERNREREQITSAGFLPYWIVWHSSLYPPPPSSSGGGWSGGGGGAAAGGGGGGGGF